MQKFIILSGLCLALVACKPKDQHSGSQQDGFELELPAHFPEPVYQFEDNPLTKQGFELGRSLFYDPILSRDQTISCGSCHEQKVAFADEDQALSLGVDNQLGLRNAPSLFNLIWQDRLMWDGGVNRLLVLPLAPINNPLEMDLSTADMVERLRSHPTYPARFKEVFGTDSIYTQLVLKAFAQFLGTMTSASATYDDHVTGAANDNWTSDAEAGLDVFKQKCNSCHTAPLFTDRSFRNNGLDATVTDSGRFLITLKPEDMGTFKVPSLRNIALSGPYMHDGRFKTLDDVLDHYSSGVQDNPNLDSELKKDGFTGIALTTAEKTQLKAFLHTLTDQAYTTNEQFMPPGP